jgi:hypothetical protein
MKNASQLLLRFDPDKPAGALHDLCQPNAGFGVPVVVAVQPLKRAEDLIVVLPRDADPVVRDREAPGRALSDQSFDRATCWISRSDSDNELYSRGSPRLAPSNRNWRLNVVLPVPGSPSTR